MTDLPSGIIAITGLLTALGGGMAFVWAKIEKRFAEIDVKLEACERRDRRSRRQLVLYEAALTVVMDELERLQPASSALTHARRLLRRALTALEDPEMDKDDEDVVALAEQ